MNKIDLNGLRDILAITEVEKFDLQNRLETQQAAFISEKNHLALLEAQSNRLKFPPKRISYPSR